MNILLIVVLMDVLDVCFGSRISGWREILTKKDDCNGNQDHENVVITDERYQSLNANGKPYVSHGAFWNVVRVLSRSAPAASRWPTRRDEECGRVATMSCVVSCLTRGLRRVDFLEWR